jgi:hypothetical protein
MKPDFFCIGMQKAGTTWLHENLKTHPQMAAPLLKEPHYFDNLHLWPGVFKHLCHEYYAESSIAEIRRAILDNLRWDIDTLLQTLGRDPAVDLKRALWMQSLAGLGEGILSDDWYQRVFSMATADLLVGDFTADTYLLDSAAIERLRLGWPQARFIMLLRDPVERDWSQLRMMLGSSTLAEVQEALSSPQMHGRERYAEIIDRWLLGVGADAIHFEFYDDIRQDPRGLLDRVALFLGLEPPADGWRSAQVVEFAGPRAALTAEIQEVLVERNREALEFLSDRFGGVCLHWRRRHLETGATAGPAS